MMTQAPSRTHSLAYHAFSDEAAVMQLRCQLLAWYDANKRALPWRRAPSEWADADEHAYHTWVSEVMSQQTRVGTAAPYYTTWTTKWPTVAALADASLADVHAVWSGLGYYSRATRMLEAAKLIVHSHGGRFPRDAATLHSDIPGIGPYTAGAVASIAFNAHAPVVDGNVVRVLSRLRALGCDPKSKAASELHWSLAGRLLDVGRPGDFNQAVMEFGATVCTPQNPSCKGCPIKMHCRAHEEFFGVKEEKDAKEVSEQEERVERKKCAQCLPDIEDCVPPFPVTRYPAMVKKKAADEKIVIVPIIEVRTDNAPSKYLVAQRPPKGLLANLWDFPHLPDDTPVSIPDILDHLPGLDELARNHIIVQKHTSVGSVTHLFSHIKLAMTVEWYVCVCVGDASSLPELTGKAEWWTREKMDEGAVPVTLKKALQLVTELAAGGSTGGAGKKRKKVMAEVKGQQSISKFFKVK